MKSFRITALIKFFMSQETLMTAVNQLQGTKHSQIKSACVEMCSLYTFVPGSNCGHLCFLMRVSELDRVPDIDSPRCYQTSADIFILWSHDCKSHIYCTFEVWTVRMILLPFTLHKVQWGLLNEVGFVLQWSGQFTCRKPSLQQGRRGWGGGRIHTHTCVTSRSFRM